MKTNKRTVFGMAALAAIAVTLMFRGYDVYQEYNIEQQKKAEIRAVEELEEFEKRQLEKADYNCKWISHAISDKGYIAEIKKANHYDTVNRHVFCETKHVKFDGNLNDYYPFNDVYIAVNTGIKAYRRNKEELKKCGTKEGKSCPLNQAKAQK